MSAPFQNIPEEYILELRQLMREFDLPYIEIELKNEDFKSPLLNVSHKLEAAINSIIADIFLAKMEEGVYLLGSLELDVDNLLTLSSYLRLKHEKNKISKFLDKLTDKKKSKRTPIPKIFEEAFDNELENRNE
tara:strand:+ start:287 stop:685 length:399 start_codon:yes stop_codon:yes gene_type:complete